MCTEQKTKTNTATHIAFVIDESGSMGGKEGDVQRIYKGQANKILSKHSPNDTISVYTFANTVKNPVSAKAPNALPPTLTYRPNGSTSLLDGVKKAITDFQSRPDASKASFLIMVITDGQENNSEATPQEVTKLILDTQKTDRWTYAFQGPPSSRDWLIKFGIPTDNIEEWEPTKAGIEKLEVQNTTGLDRYLTARSMGVTKIDTFYKDINLENIKPKDIKKELEDVTSDYKVLEVTKEIDIKSFLEQKTGKYTIGSCFYQLSKPELIQPNKQILIIEKGKNKIYGGQEARDLIGLVSGANTKVNPFNLSKWEIFVESRSVNRKLVRGTKVLLNKHSHSHKNPTWGTLEKALA